MKRFYSTFRFCLMTFALGLAAVYSWSGFSIIFSEVPVDLPSIKSNDNVLVVFPAEAPVTGYESRELRLARIIGDRELSSYDRGTHAQSCDWGESEVKRDCLAIRQAARDFIYSHFKAQQKGYIEVGFPCTDCGPVDHIFIEPDRLGRWKITITLDTNGPPSTSTARSVRFRRATREERYDEYPTKVLSFVDASGRELEAF